MSKNTVYLYFGLAVAVPLIVFLSWNLAETKSSNLKVYGEEEVLADGTEVPHTISDFEFIDQKGRSVTQENFEDKIYVANFFFAVCPTICPKMTSQMYRVQEEFSGNDDIALISHSVDPVRDSVPVLAEYALNNSVDPDQWYLVTGDKKAIYQMARNDYLVTAMEGDGGPYDFIHSELLVLVDREKQIRGFYDGTDEKAVDDLINDIYTLLKEKN